MEKFVPTSRTFPSVIQFQLNWFSYSNWRRIVLLIAAVTSTERNLVETPGIIDRCAFLVALVIVLASFAKSRVGKM